MERVRFMKMHGLGNDFVVVDAREGPLALSPATARAIADRRTGVGCDQLIIVEPASNGQADVFMRIINADGGEVGACGNATRCVASLIMSETAHGVARIETAAGVLEAQAAADGRVSVNMGRASLNWADIPLARDLNALHLPVDVGDLRDPVGVGIGNPHAVFFVADAQGVPLVEVGPVIEHHPLFPQRTNVEVAQICGRDRIRLRVWERGAGITLACGTGACASVVAAVHRGLVGRRVTVDLDGGALEIDYLPTDHVVMTGPVATSFTGVFDRSLISA